MNFRSIFFLIFCATGLLFVGDIAADTESDAVAIRQAVLNYANSAYDVRADLIEKSVHPRLQKVGYTSRDGTVYREAFMDFTELKELVSKWNADGHFDSKSARRDIKILDQFDRIAVARLDAEWGVDFFQLSKVGTEWKIVNVIWQTYPPE